MITRRFWVHLVPILALHLAGVGCGIGTTIEDPLDPVDAMDDMAATAEDREVNIVVLANDLQDDDLVTSVTQAMDDMGNMQPGSVEIDFLTFPEQLTYIPPTGFTGTVTFDYTITGLGIVYDYTTEDTATVTVIVTPGLPSVLAVDDMETTLVDQPVVIDVLINDSQDADVIDSFSDAMDEIGNLQMDSVALQTNGSDALLYTPPMGFAGTVTFDYTIIGAGIDFELDSEDSAVATVNVEDPISIARVQFADRSMEVFEILLFFITQASIDANAPDAMIFAPSGETICFGVEAGVNVPVRARLLLDEVTIVDGVCPNLIGGMDYTVQVQPDGSGGLEIVCVDGLAEPDLCI